MKCQLKCAGGGGGCWITWLCQLATDEVPKLFYSEGVPKKERNSREMLQCWGTEKIKGFLIPEVVKCCLGWNVLKWATRCLCVIWLFHDTATWTNINGFYPTVIVPKSAPQETWKKRVLLWRGPVWVKGGRLLQLCGSPFPTRCSPDVTRWPFPEFPVSMAKDS